MSGFNRRHSLRKKELDSKQARKKREANSKGAVQSKGTHPNEHRLLEKPVYQPISTNPMDSLLGARAPTQVLRRFLGGAPAPAQTPTPEPSPEEVKEPEGKSTE